MIAKDLASLQHKSYVEVLNGAGNGTGNPGVVLVYPDGNPLDQHVPVHINTDTTTTVKSTAGALHTVVVNKASTNGTATIQDGGSILAVLDTTKVGSYLYDMAHRTDITIVTASGTPADITVTYR